MNSPSSQKQFSTSVPALAVSEYLHSTPSLPHMSILQNLTKHITKPSEKISSTTISHLKTPPFVEVTFSQKFLLMRNTTSCSPIHPTSTPLSTAHKMASRPTNPASPSTAAPTAWK